MAATRQVVPLINKMAFKHHESEMETPDSSTMRIIGNFWHIGIAGQAHHDNNTNKLHSSNAACWVM